MRVKCEQGPIVRYGGEYVQFFDKMADELGLF